MIGLTVVLLVFIYFIFFLSFQFVVQPLPIYPNTVESLKDMCFLYQSTLAQGNSFAY